MDNRDERLVRELLRDPRGFDSKGKAHELLQEYFQGKSLETLRPLLKHDNAHVRRSAAFIVSELGKTASCLIYDIAPLVSDSDTHIQWYAIESIMACTNVGNYEYFIVIVEALDDPNSSICRLAMRLAARANIFQIEAAIRNIGRLRAHQKVHEQGLRAMLEWEALSDAEIIALLNDHNDLLRKYGAMISNRRMTRSTTLIQLATQSEDECMACFAKEALANNDIPQRYWSHE